MILKKIHLQNIRSYQDQEVIFKEGSTLLSGDIGCGKTSILLAIEFGLFGLQPGQRGNALLRNGATEGKVRIEFSVNENEVTIERSLKRAKTISQDYASIEINGEKSELSVTEIKTKVLELLDYPKEFAKKQNILYKFTVYTPQEEMKQIILQDSETRLNTLRHVFGIDKYKTIIENSSLILSKVREQKKVNQILAEGLEEQKQNLFQKELDLREKEIALEKTNSELKQKKEITKKCEIELEEIKSKLEEKIKLEQEIEKTKLIISTKNQSILENKKTLEELKTQISQIEEISFDPEEIQKTENELENLKNKLNEISKKLEEKNRLENEIENNRILIKSRNETISNNNRIIEKIENEISELNKTGFSKERLEEIQKSLEKTKSEKKELENHQLELTSKMHSLNAKIDDNISIKDKLSHIEVCPTCMQDVNESYKKNVLNKIESSNEKNSSEISNLRLEKEKNVLQVQMLETKITDLEKEFSDLKLKEAKLSDLQEKRRNLEDIKQSNEDLQKEITQLVEKEKSIRSSLIHFPDLDKTKIEIGISELNKRLNELTLTKFKKESISEKKFSLENIERSNKTLRSDMDLLTRQIDLLKSSVFELNKYKNISNEIETKLEFSRREERLCEIRIAELKKEIEFFQKATFELKEQIEKTEKIKQKVIYLSNLESWLSQKFIKVISNIERNVMVTLKNEFSNLFSKWFGMLVSESFNVRLNDDFTPVIEQQDYEIDYSYLSGGERTAIALAYRLALNQVINSMLSKIKTKDLVILDEPTDGFSDAQLDKMREVLDELNVKQLVIVSHEQKIEGFVENVMKFKKENGNSFLEN